MPSPRALSRFEKKEITSLMRRARSACRMPGLDIRVAPISTEGKAYGRLIVITPRAVGNAVERNLLRRQIKSIFYEEKLFERRFDWLFFVKKELVGTPISEIKKIILDCSAQL